MEILAIQFTFENCECITVPKDCFSNLKYKIDGKYLSNFEASVKDNLNIDCSELYNKSVSPIKRISKNDITQIDFIYDNGSRKNYYISWHGYNDEVNLYQKSDVYSYVSMDISINKRNFAEDISHVLSYYEVGDKFTDYHGCTCIIDEDNNGKYLSSVGVNGEEIKTYLDVVMGKFYKE